MSSVISVYVSLGSNIEPQRHIVAGVNALAASFSSLIISTVYENPAYGFVGPDFYNLVVGFCTELPLASLYERLEEIESIQGPSRARFNSRHLDIDLLLYGDAVLSLPSGNLPREDILEYAFVACPLAEIAGHHRHPVVQKTFAQIWQEFDKTGVTLKPVALMTRPGCAEEISVVLSEPVLL